MGVFATRSPHRPCPIGLSVARVVAVEGRTLVLGGADVVDGSPVLDIKPYVPFCDDVPGASAPPWVAARADDEPLSVGQLRVPPAAEAALRQCWWRLGARSQYSSFEEYRQLVAEVGLAAPAGLRCLRACCLDVCAGVGAAAGAGCHPPAQPGVTPPPLHSCPHRCSLETFAP